MYISKVFGIGIIINPFFILLLFVAAAFGKLAPVLLLFFLVIWHEVAHTIVARYYGLHVSEIELLPFGGVARIDELLQLDPHKEALVALAGPLSNLVLLILGGIASQYYVIPNNWYYLFVQANFGLFAFNLLPALPLDGGRILRSRLVTKHGYRKATEHAVIIAQIIASLLALLGTIGSLYCGYLNQLVFVGLGFFIFTAACKEKQITAYIFMRYLTRKRQEFRVKRVMITKELAASSETSVGEVMHQFSPPYFHIVWVIDQEGKIIGVLTELELINGLLERGFRGKLSEFINFHF